MKLSGLLLTTRPLGIDGEVYSHPHLFERKVGQPAHHRIPHLKHEMWGTRLGLRIEIWATRSMFLCPARNNAVLYKSSSEYLPAIVAGNAKMRMNHPKPVLWGHL